MRTALALVLAALAGCAAAPLPPCERYSYGIAYQNGEPAGVFLDLENVVKLHALVTGLAAGTCRMPAAPGTTS